MAIANYDALMTFTLCEKFLELRTGGIQNALVDERVSSVDEDLQSFLELPVLMTHTSSFF
ncbi:hypothetical protein RUM43_009824 [Polyplax serrata]|uniref:Uncharacterized protein n=1 Tax=Polyplax serrata TaxID=468196 RepID=A0AAN8PJR3_POLSC